MLAKLSSPPNSSLLLKLTKDDLSRNTGDNRKKELTWVGPPPSPPSSSAHMLTYSAQFLLLLAPWKVWLLLRIHCYVENLTF
jgi:hypothetical protein